MRSPRDQDPARDDARARPRRPARPFPLIRHLSFHATRWLARTPATPNQVTLASLGAGLAAAGLFASGAYEAGLAGALLLVLAYVLDNADGELARLRGAETRFGEVLDSFTDWFVHFAVFIGLGIGAARDTGDQLWIWLGALAALGGTIDYAIVLSKRTPGRRPAAQSGDGSRRSGAGRGHALADSLLYALRGLARNDFCFLVAIVVLLEATRPLLVAAAIGAQAYWATALVRNAVHRHW